jgi:hypothetical protein
MKDRKSKPSSDPVANPWEPPTSEEKQAARPVKRTIKKSLDGVDSNNKAEKIIEEIEAATEGIKAEDVVRETPQPRSLEQVSRRVEQASQTTPKEGRTKEVLTETARQVLALEGRDQEILSDIAQEAAGIDCRRRFSSVLSFRSNLIFGENVRSSRSFRQS